MKGLTRDQRGNGKKIVRKKDRRIRGAEETGRTTIGNDLGKEKQGEIVVLLTNYSVPSDLGH